MSYFPDSAAFRASPACLNLDRESKPSPAKSVKVQDKEKAGETLVAGLDLTLEARGDNFPICFWGINRFCSGLWKKLTVHPSAAC